MATLRYWGLKVVTHAIDVSYDENLSAWRNVLPACLSRMVSIIELH